MPTPARRGAVWPPVPLACDAGVRRAEVPAGDGVTLAVGIGAAVDGCACEVRGCRRGVAFAVDAVGVAEVRDVVPAVAAGDVLFEDVDGADDEARGVGDGELGGLWQPAGYGTLAGGLVEPSSHTQPSVEPSAGWYDAAP